MMKKFLPLVMFVVATAGGVKAQSFLDRLPTVNTGVKGCIISEYAFLKVYSDDETTYPLKNGTSIELLNYSSIKDKSNLNTLKIKITYDSEGTKTGMIGYVYPSATSFTNCFNYSTSRVECVYTTMIPTVTTGYKGEVTYDGLNFVEDATTVLPLGTKFELLNTKMIETIDCFKLPIVKIKVLEGQHKGKVGCVYASLTNFNGNIDYTNLIIKGPAIPVTTSTTTTTPAVDATLPTYPTERTGITGTVTLPTGAFAYEDDNKWLTEFKLAENATFLLLNKKVYLDVLNSDYYIKVKVTNDPTGAYTNKILYITILDTSLSTRFDSTSGSPVVN